MAEGRFHLFPGARLQTAVRVHPEIATGEDGLCLVHDSDRGVAALPRWLVEAYAGKLELAMVRLGAEGIAKHIFVGVRRAEAEIDCLHGFLKLARARRDRAGDRQ